ACAFKPNSHTLAVGTQKGFVLLYDLTGENRPPRELARVPLPTCLAFDLAGEKLAVCSRQDRQVTVIDVKTGKELRRLPVSTDAYCLAWHPDGRRLAVGCWEADASQRFPITIWDVDDAREPLLLYG